MSNPVVYIIIVNYNDYIKTISCIKSISNINYQSYKILVVDNNSTNGSIQKIKESIENKINKLSYGSNDIKGIKIITNHYNGGYASGINLGIKYIKNNNQYSFIWAMNNDVLIEESALTALVEKFKNSNNISIFGSKIYNEKTKKIESMGGIIDYNNLTTKHVTELNEEIDYISGVALFFHKNIIEINGLFPDKYFMYYEDVDWCTKAKNNNIDLVIAVRSILYHNNNHKVSFKLKVYSLFNRIRYCIKYYPNKFSNVVLGILFSKLYVQSD